MRSLTAVGVAAAFSIVLADGLENAVANGDTRSLSFHHIHTNEALTVTFKRDGRYDAKALEQLNWFLRDWRVDQPTRMDPQLFDLLWEVNREVGGKEPITIISAYRSPNTNSMLRRRGRGVARYSQHMVGRAIDFFIPNVELADLRAAGLRLQRGGVGFYPTSGSPFIHVDTGGVRHWPRMTRDQLARVFPDGKTVHIPSDGKPMAGFEVALAALEKRGGRPATIALASRDDAPAGEVPDSQAPERAIAFGSGMKRLVASMFGGREEEEEDAPASTARRRLPTATALTAGPPPPGSTPPPAATAPRPTAVAALAPTLPEQRAEHLRWQAGPAGTPVASVPLPLPRPSDIAETTASLPEAIVGRPAPQRHGAALAYAPADANLAARPPVATRAVLAARPALERREVPHALPAPADVFERELFLFVAELHHPDLDDTRGLIEPVRAVLRSSFGEAYALAPATARFAGPAVVPLPVVGFDRGAIGSRLARRN
jgi:uncharacterized protein YcbK (DUF882 family)